MLLLLQVCSGCADIIPSSNMNHLQRLHRGGASPKIFTEAFRDFQRLVESVSFHKGRKLLRTFEKFSEPFSVLVLPFTYKDLSGTLALEAENTLRHDHAF